MSDATRDQNRVPVAIAASNADGKTTLPLYADPTTRRLHTSDALTGSDSGNPPTGRDNNRRPIFYAVSAVDGVTPVAIYIDSITNALLIRSS